MPTQAPISAGNRLAEQEPAVLSPIASPWVKPVEQTDSQITGNDLYAAPLPSTDTVPIPDMVPPGNLPAGNLTQPVEPMEIFGESLMQEPVPVPEPISTAQSGASPLLDLIAAQAEADSTIEIAPLLDKVYGGQYLTEVPEAAAVVAAPHTVEPATPVPGGQSTDAGSMPIEQPLNVEQLPSMEQLPIAEQQPITETIVEESSESLLDVLSSLESELLGKETDEEYDVNKLLGEYGFKADE
jgi:hypothetical protein